VKYIKPVSYSILVILWLTLIFSTVNAYAGSTQSNTSGSNTAIEGGYTGGATTYESGSTSTSTSTNSSTSNIKSSPPTAAAPSFSAQSQDVCATGASVGMQTFGLGLSGGKTFRDMNCERIKLAKVLYDFGMKVGSVALLCQDERVFEAMINAGTPCPIDGQIGKNAMAIWKKYDFERPDYKTYVKRMKKRDKIDKSIHIQELKIIELESDK
jgi:hypothetical protein|tara:strand:- start:53 stop:688 length:636 start_codon:yes stop_codon:yes gene_type:complete